MRARFTLLPLITLALLIVLGVTGIPASRRPSGGTDLAATIRPGTTMDRDVYGTRERREADSDTGDSGWSTIGRNALLAAASESMRMEPVTLFVMGSLLLTVATFARLRIMRRVKGETELRLSRNAHR